MKPSADDQYDTSPPPGDERSSESIRIVFRRGGRVNRWIESCVRGRSFVDVGGLGGNAINEKVTVALDAGAASATMIDIIPADHVFWQTFRAKCAAKGYCWRSNLRRTATLGSRSRSRSSLALESTRLREHMGC